MTRSPRGRGYRRRLLASALVLALVAAVWVQPLTGLGMRYLDRSIREGVVVFVAARAVNAAIAVIKGSEIQVEPFGIGAVVAAGKVLEPLDDLLQRFTWVLFASLAVLASEKVLLGLMSVLTVKVALSALAVPALLAAWLGPRRGVAGALGRVFVLGMLVRFVPVLVVLLAQGVYLGFLSGQLTDASRALHAQTRGVQEIARAPGAASGGSVAGELRDHAQVLARLPGALRTLKQDFDQIVQQVVLMVGIFLLEIVVLPLGFSWLLWRGSRRVMAALEPGAAASASG